MASPGDLHKRLSELERKVDMLMEHLGLTYQPEPLDWASHEVIDLVSQGQKIQAVKLHREQTGLGLKEAKDVVDAIERRVRGGS